MMRFSNQQQHRFYCGDLASGTRWASSEPAISIEIQLRPMLIHRGYPADASKPEVLTILSPVIVELEWIAPCGTSPWCQVRGTRMVLGIAASRLHTQRCCTQLSLLCTRSIQGTS